MMPPVGRLKTRPEFLKVAATGTKWVTPGLILQMRRRPATARPAAEVGRPEQGPGQEDEVRVGFTVSRKVGNAVRRNRARRRLRAVAEEVLTEFGQAGCDYVLIGRAGTLERPHAALVEDLQAALERIGKKQGRKPRRAAQSADRRASRSD